MSIRVPRLYLLWFLLLLAGGLLQQPVLAWADLKIPDLTGRVVDQADLLDTNVRQRLSAELARYEAQTSTQIVVVTLPDLQGYPIEEWGLALLRGWQIGQKGKNNGVVLVVAPNDRQVRIETGYGAEGPLPDATASLIIRSVILPYFRQSDYAGGILAAVNAIEAALNSSFTADGAASLKESAVSVAGVSILGQQVPWLTVFIISIWVMIVLINLLRGRGNGSRIYSGTRRQSYWTGWGGGGGFGGFGGGGFGGGGGSGGGGGASGRW